MSKHKKTLAWWVGVATIAATVILAWEPFIHPALSYGQGIVMAPSTEARMQIDILTNTVKVARLEHRVMALDQNDNSLDAKDEARFELLTNQIFNNHLEVLRQNDTIKLLHDDNVDMMSIMLTGKLPVHRTP